MALYKITHELNT